MQSDLTEDWCRKNLQAKGYYRVQGCRLEQFEHRRDRHG